MSRRRGSSPRPTSRTIALLADAHASTLCAHIWRHGKESGTDGDVIFQPRLSGEELDVPAAIERHRAEWGRPLFCPQWLRTWGLFEDEAAGPDATIVGHLDLRGGRLPAELHRATLGMGLERPARRQGHGRALIETAIVWARARGLAWLDLGVFAHNRPARALYESMGFVEVGTTRDQFRVDEASIDDVAMTLRL
ncbi:MAG TPA: GNAT family N-acetyltransferase [Kofleriaceae bacterium]|nr:GNAT family N-acetyltransferase [Kofleriaceae bacterium]